MTTIAERVAKGAAARHASAPDRAAARTVLAIAVVLAVLAALWVQNGEGANTALPHPWHYPCVMHLAQGGRDEWFTPARDFWKGLCQQ